MLAIKGITSQEQNGARPPTKAAKKITLTSLPWKDFEIMRSAPDDLR